MIAVNTIRTEINLFFIFILDRLTGNQLDKLTV
jgi:hypothetical protein